MSNNTRLKIINSHLFQNVKSHFDSFDNFDFKFTNIRSLNAWQKIAANIYIYIY
ncbi:hypothetical protein [[Mycoplasma] gypis]|uniref:Uncharacterized protein n=1 Tax=[Mycoplasma] gypis TaxID=92404 RepID=A0ABZ2RQJ4_9BACT|nr:hypothetical protein [[Mycoplasma] gypis]MBN0919661.1 hypothetical protein [[Mycoplasma] gypis]